MGLGTAISLTCSCSEIIMWAATGHPTHRTKLGLRSLYTMLLMQIFVLPSPLWGQKTANQVN